MKSSLIFGLVIASLIQFSQGSNILFISALPSPSHHILKRVLALGLANKGHNVTFLSADQSDKIVNNLHYIHLDGIYQAFEAEISPDEMMQTDQSALIRIKMFWKMCFGLGYPTLNSPGIDVILNYPKDFKFDAVIFDFTTGPFLIPLVTRFNNPPLISITAFVNPPYTTDYIGGHKYPAYLPHYSVNYETNMNFIQRFYNTLIYIVDWM
jgi:glucuronosyltransferase